MEKGDVLLVQNLACFGVRSKNLYEILTILAEQEKFFVAIKEQVDTRAPSGQSFYKALGYIYRMEREVISSHTLTAIQEARKNGANVGRPKIDAEKINEIRFLYRKKNISMREIAEMVGASVGSVSKYLKNE